MANLSAQCIAYGKRAVQLQSQVLENSIVLNDVWHVMLKWAWQKLDIYCSIVSIFDYISRA